MAKRRNIERDERGRFAKRGAGGKKKPPAPMGARGVSSGKGVDEEKVRPGRKKGKAKRGANKSTPLSKWPTPTPLKPTRSKTVRPKAKKPKEPPKLRDARGRFTTPKKLRAQEARERRRQLEEAKRLEAERRSAKAKKGWETRRKNAEKRRLEALKKREAPCGPVDLESIQARFENPPWPLPQGGGWWLYRDNGTSEGYLERWLSDGETTVEALIALQNWLALPLSQRPDLWVSAGVMFQYRGDADRYERFKGQSVIWKYSRPAPTINTLLQAVRAVADRLADSGARVLALVVAAYCGFRPEDK